MYRLSLPALTLFISGCTLLLSGSGRLDSDDGDADIDADTSHRPDADSEPDADRSSDADHPTDADRDVEHEDADVDDDADADDQSDADSDDCPPTPPSTATELVALEADSELEVDGSTVDWSADEMFALLAPDDVYCPPEETDCPDDVDDISTTFAVRWSSEALYLAMVVVDDVHINEETARHIFRGDSVQIGLDMDLNRSEDYDDDDRELGWALTDLGIKSFRWHPEQTAPFSGMYAIVRAGTRTVYEIEIPVEELGDDVFLRPELRLGFALIVNDADVSGEEREGFLEWASGIGTNKRPASFGTIRLYSIPEECRPTEQE